MVLPPSFSHRTGIKGVGGSQIRLPEYHSGADQVSHTRLLDWAPALLPTTFPTAIRPRLPAGTDFCASAARKRACTTTGATATRGENLEYYMGQVCVIHARVHRKYCVYGYLVRMVPLPAYCCSLPRISACTTSCICRAHTPAYAWKPLMPTATSACNTFYTVMLLAFGSDWPNVLNLQESGPNT